MTAVLKVGYLTSKKGGLFELIKKTPLFDDIFFTIYTNKYSEELEQRALNYHTPLIYHNKIEELVEQTRNERVMLSAGYLKIIPGKDIKRLPPILNIHPGIKGYEGLHPQKRMLADKVPYVGQYIHVMDETLDGGEKLFYGEYKNKFNNITDLDVFLKQQILTPLYWCLNMYR